MGSFLILWLFVLFGRLPSHSRHMPAASWPSSSATDAAGANTTHRRPPWRRCCSAFCVFFIVAAFVVPILLFSITLFLALPLWGVDRIALRELRFRGQRLTVSFDAAQLTLLVIAPPGSAFSGRSGDDAGNTHPSASTVGWVLDAAGANHTLAVAVPLVLPVQPVQVWLADAASPLDSSR